MVYPKNFENKLGFDILRNLLKEYCLSELGRKYVDKIHFSDNFDLINKLLCQTDEFRQVTLFESRFPEQDYFDLTKEILKINVVGTFIELDALFNLKTSLTTIIDCITFIRKLDNEKYPFLKELITNVSLDRSIITKINEIVDEKGKIKDSASPDLQRIRKDFISKQHIVEKKINHYLNSFRKQGFIPENEMPTVRNGRTVLPVYAADKRKVKGIIQDESATGQTVFIEPEEVIIINNELRELEYEERREIIRILIAFSDFLRHYIEDLINCYRFLGMIDFIRAKAKLAIETEAVKPNILKDTIINWAKAKHPLLIISHNKQQKKVVPNDIYLDKKQRILIISGPNAGGKSVYLKTVGLLQYMLQCGLLIPIAEHSDTGIFKKLFIDIGDEQSIENDLSTYSSHLLNLKYFIANSDNKTLILLDELGAGTEPQMGGAIAEASLEEINRNKAFGIVTTHYTNLKMLADKTEGLFNGSMLFDTKKLLPSYKLKTGIMGSSYAFEIARKIGFQKKVLDAAEQKTGIKQVNFEKSLIELESKKHEIEVKEKEFNIADDILAEYIAKYKKLYEELEKTKKTIINDAKKKAEDILLGSNKVIEKTIKDIKENQADKEKTKKAREEIEKYKVEVGSQKTEKINKNIKAKNKKPKLETRNTKLETPFKTGDYVRAIGKTAIGELIDILDDEAIVAFNSFNMKLPLEELEKVTSESPASRLQKLRSKSNVNLNERISNFKSTIDVRGKRADEALAMLEKFVDDALLINVKNVNIIHGKGNGILRQLIRDYLKNLNSIKEFKDESSERGGDGVTVIRFK